MENQIYVKSNGVLKKVLVASPKNFEIIKPINNTEKKTFKKGISKAKLIREYENFVALLQKQKVEVVKAPLKKSLPQQTFTRDIGFCIGNTLFVANSNVDMRKDETFVFKKLFKNHKNIYHFKNHIEGGDVLIYGKTVFVGISKRTKEEAADELQEVLGKKFKVVMIFLKPHILHLDTVFNFVGDVAVYNPQGVAIAFDVYNYFDKVIQVLPEQQYFLPSNFLPLSKKRIIASKQNHEFNAQLKQFGIRVIEGDFDEMLKLGGSYRCCSFEIIKKWII